MPDPRAVVALLIILFIILSPGPQSPATQLDRSRFDHIIEREEQALHALNNSRYGHFDALDHRWLNASGFTEDAGYAWTATEAIKTRARKLNVYALGDSHAGMIDGGVLNHGDVALYNNVTGVLHGSWIPSLVSATISKPQLNLTNYAPEGPFGKVAVDEFSRNLTGLEGSIKLRLDETDTQEDRGGQADVDSRKMAGVRTVSARIDLQAYDGSAWEVTTHGVHFLASGSLVLTTTSEKYVYMT